MLDVCPFTGCKLRQSTQPIEMEEEKACPYGSSIVGVHAHNRQGSRACHPIRCLGVRRICLTALPLLPALRLYNGQGARGLDSGKLATSSFDICRQTVQCQSAPTA